MNQKMPLVTVIVACYNHEKYVKRCIDSIYRQSYSNLEVIIIDDCSMDDSVTVINKLQEQYLFSFIKHNKNLGLINTLNEVIINYAHGKYIKAIASDDYFSDDCIMVLVQKLEQLGDEYSLAYAKSQAFEDHEGTLKMLPVILGDFVTHEQLIFEKNKIPANTVLFNRQRFMEIGAIPDMYIEDLYMWMRLSENHKIIFIDKILTYYQVNSNSDSMSKNHPKMMMGLIANISMYLVKNKKLDFDYAYRGYQKINNEFLYFITDYVNQCLKKDKKRAINLYFNNLFYFIWKKQIKFLFYFWIKIILL
jgi:alpha-1,3-rhamnosyltransferase